ncbi:MAG: hydrolase [Mycobacterium sp.]|nr:hydrolase [Mycobacterium sp.]
MSADSAPKRGTSLPGENVGVDSSGSGAARLGEIAVSVDVVLLTLRAGRLSILLVAGRDPRDPLAWALPGGRIAITDSLEGAARQALADQAGVGRLPGHLEQLRTYGDPGRDSRGRVVSVGYLALLPDLPRPAGGIADRVRWWPVEDLNPTTSDGSDAGARLAFDHAVIVADGVERARAKLEYTSLAVAFVDEPFTLAELRRVYEAAWGVALDPPNFRRKVLSAPGFVQPVGERSVPPGGGRPAELYRRGDAVNLSPPLLRPPGATTTGTSGSPTLGPPA